MPRWTKEDLLRYEQRTKSIKPPRPKIEHPAVGAVGATKRKQGEKPALVKKPRRVKSGQGSVVIRCSIIACRHRLLDDDNGIAGAKPLRDAIARTFSLDDADPRIKFEYGQHQTNGEQGVIVKIDRE